MAAVVATLGAALVAGSALLVVDHGRSGDPEVGGYPQRIGFERPSDRLPDRPGALAGTLYDNDFGNGRHLGIAATGRLWELPSGTSLLSPSGERLLTQPARRPRRLVVRDLTTGDRWALDRTRPGSLRPDARLSWSPDETAVLGDFARTRHAGPRHSAVLDLASGAVTEVGRGYPAGFRSPSEPVTVHTVGEPGAVDGIVATITDSATGAHTDLPLRLAGPWLGDPASTLVASVAPDGRTIVLVEDSGDRSSTRVRAFSMVDGAELAPRSVRDWDGCPPSWRGQDPVLPTTTQPGGPGSARAAGARLLTEDGSTPLVAVHPRLQSTCLQLTAAALAAGPRWSFFGPATALWTWYWFPALVVVSLLVLGLFILYRTGRRTWATRTGRGHDPRQRRRSGTLGPDSVWALARWVRVR